MAMGWANKSFSVERCDEVPKHFTDCDGDIDESGHLLVSRDGAALAIYPPNSWTAVLFG